MQLRRIRQCPGMACFHWKSLKDVKGALSEEHGSIWSIVQITWLPLSQLSLPAVSWKSGWSKSKDGDIIEGVLAWRQARRRELESSAEFLDSFLRKHSIWLDPQDHLWRIQVYILKCVQMLPDLNKIRQTHFWLYNGVKATEIGINQTWNYVLLPFSGLATM